MSDIITDGKTKVWEVPAIADVTAPTVTELDAGQQLENRMTPDGLAGFEPETADVDNTALSSTFDTRLPGRASWSNTQLILKKQSGTDEVYDTLVRDYDTHIVVRRGTNASDAWAADDEVEVYPVRCGQVSNNPPEANSVQRYTVPVKVTGDPEIRAVVTTAA
ncbi:MULTISPECIES: phage tail tube protein [Prauserella salsuginis group]|uniref:Major tail protein n=2 Tax=Prauserella salsuginis group TaxID=2893672 RepID=A0A839XUI1_9PSEU|nr:MULTISPECIES: hypothetical protein [Prauserella salsuginis group]MBB3666397.1 hypothetical protein [Prauserella sediminis]MCR3719135.1 hypothetical protein [Prauserella flava]MCR3735852.1 hypothetical protein [Prauserella salsuginis]